jgi:magnesium transporter
MSPRYVNVRAGQTAADALAKVRRASGLRPREVLVLPVTDDQRKLVGVSSTCQIWSPPTVDTRVGDLIRPETYSVHVDEDQEVAARLMQEADLVALPVLDSEDRLVGVLTVDDAMEVLEAEDTEDIQRCRWCRAARRALHAGGVLHLARKRAVWLLILIVAAVATVNVLEAFEETLEAVVALALFIPLLIDTGGNSGSQAATVVIRAMAVGEVQFRDLPRILHRELRVGLLLGLMLGAVGFPIVALFYGMRLRPRVSSTLVVICTWASFAGGLLPLMAKRLGIDPAVVSAPMITTLVDATGLIIYFLLARAVLGV